MGTSSTTRLRTLLQKRHWQTYSVFRKEYDRAAVRVDEDLVGSWPSRAQLHRWVSGDLKGLPHANHCRVLESMFAGWSAERLFEQCDPNEAVEATQLLDIIATELRDANNGAGDLDDGSGGAAPAIDATADVDIDETAGRLAKKLTTVKRVHRMSSEETRDLAALAGSLVELSLSIAIDIDEDGGAIVAYQHEVMNMTDRPLTRLARELWFENADAPLAIEPIDGPKRRVAIQRLHDAGSLAKFGCRFSPAVRPGDTATFGYTCRGGRFVDAHYWRQSIARPTRHFTITIQHALAHGIRSCAATEEHVNGAENSIDEDLMWECDDSTTVMTLARDNLAAGQAVTVRWEAAHAAA